MFSPLRRLLSDSWTPALQRSGECDGRAGKLVQRNMPPPACHLQHRGHPPTQPLLKRHVVPLLLGDTQPLPTLVAHARTPTCRRTQADRQELDDRCVVNSLSRPMMRCADVPDATGLRHPFCCCVSVPPCPYAFSCPVTMVKAWFVAAIALAACVWSAGCVTLTSFALACTGRWIALTLTSERNTSWSPMWR